tara:strand:- start:1001 stop:1189 length:189 start_codon:yes stop_codon:yes gene_type:complete
LETFGNIGNKKDKSAFPKKWKHLETHGNIMELWSINSNKKSIDFLKTSFYALKKRIKKDKKG